MIDWNIQSRSHHCQACEQKFTDKQSYHTVLSDEKHEYRRLDVCDACWQAQYAADAKDRKGYISHWQGVYHAPPAAPPEAIQKDTAETLLRKLMELNDPKHSAACYILAVMLERKRLLKVQSQYKQDGRRIFVYEQPKTADIFTIPDPDLQLDQLEQVQHDVASLLEHGLPAPEGEQPSETAVAGSETTETSAENGAEPEPGSEPVEAADETKIASLKEETCNQTPDEETLPASSAS